LNVFPIVARVFQLGMAMLLVVAETAVFNVGVV
jgi:hypothetical protein